MNDDPSVARSSDLFTPTTPEAPTTSPALARWLAITARLAAAMTAVIGAAVLVGWAMDVEWLQDPIGSFQHMVPNTALMLLLSGLSLSLAAPASARRRRVWTARALAAASAALAFATLAQDVLGRDFGIDALLFDASPARPAAPTSTALLLSGVALLALDVRPRRGPRPAELLAVVVAAIGLLTLGGYLFGAIQFYVSDRHPRAVGMAIHTAVALVLLAVGILAARPSSGAMATATSPLVGGQVARRMFLVVLAIPILSFLAVRAQQAGYYVPPGAAIVAAVAGMIVAGLIVLLVAHSLNLSDVQRRRVEEEIREWKRFFDRATFGAVFGTLDGRLVRPNEAFARMHGYTVDELVGTPVADLFPSDLRAELAENIRITHERGHCRWESEHIRKDGTVFPVVIDLSAIRDEQGKLLYRAAYVQDITEEKKAEAARARLASLVQSADDAIIAKTLDGVVLDWNRGAERVYGYTAGEIVGHAITAVVPDDRRAEQDALGSRVLGGETVVGFETIRVRKDGTRIPVALTLSPIRDPAGRVVGISTIERDISKLKQLEREREEWSSVVAHDLRQPASTIRLGAEVLARVEGPARQRAVERIRRASGRLERMIADLLDVSRIEAQHLALRPERVSLPAVINEALDLAPHIAPRCRTEIEPDATGAWADTGRLIQVLSNLLSNADKYGTPDTPIEVSVARCGEMVQVTVTNEGPGIAPDEIPKLFSRFVRTRSAQSGAAEGLGLGLYICRGLIEALGGKLWAESVPGEKTHFRFTLPSASAPEHKLTA